jgi:error-prone DNA polymerase
VPANQLHQIADGENVRVAGIVLVRQRPGTAKGTTFVTIEDETGPINLLIWLDVWKKFYKISYTAHGYLVHGRLQNHKDVIHVVVSKLENLPKDLSNMNLRARNFH